MQKMADKTTKESTQKIAKISIIAKELIIKTKIYILCGYNA